MVTEISLAKDSCNECGGVVDDVDKKKKIEEAARERSSVLSRYEIINNNWQRNVGYEIISIHSLDMRGKDERESERAKKNQI